MRATQFNTNMSYEDFLDQSKTRAKRKIWTDIEIIDNQVLIYIWDFGHDHKSYIVSYHSSEIDQRKIVSKAEYKRIGGDIHKSIFILEMHDISNKELQLEVFDDWKCVHYLTWTYDTDKCVFKLNRK